MRTIASSMRSWDGCGNSDICFILPALYKDASIIILDEPTADPVAEAEVYSRFQEMVEGKTGIYISHRMSSCQFCDEILVFHEGEIIERGSHEKLHALGGKYTELWDAQARYYA